MEVRLASAADAARFDACVAAASTPDFLQTWGWGELKAATGWRPWRLLGTDGGRCVAACSILERSVPGLGPLFYAPRGPLLDWGDRGQVDAMMAAVRDLARRRGAVVLKLDPARRHGDADCEAALARHGFRACEAGPNFEGVQPRFVMHLPLVGRGADDLLGAFHSKTRYNVRLAERRGVRVRVGGREDLPAFYTVLLETARRDRFLVRSLDYFQRMWDTLLGPGLGRLYLAEVDGDLLAGAICFQVGRTTWYLYGASANHRRDLMAPYAVQWSMIRWALDSDCSLYDFRGVSGDLDPENPLYGLYRFKRGFGGELVEYVGEFDRPYRPARYWLLRHGLPLARRVLAALRGRAAARGEAPALGAE